MDPFDLDRPDLPLYGLFLGIVTDRSDPAQLGRVRIRIPAVAEESTGWALPLGTVGGGDANRGFFAVPELGSEVGVLFHQGDVDQPHYLCGNWGRPNDTSDVPTAARDKGIERTPLVKAFETAEYQLYFDDGEDSKVFSVTHKATETSVTINGNTGSIDLNAQANISITANGQITIDGLVVAINGIPAGSGRI